MEIKDALQVPEQPVEGAPGATIRWLWTEEDGAPTFALRLIELPPGASTPYHHHRHEHEVYILGGEGILRNSEGDHPVAMGDTALIRPDEGHQIINRGERRLSILCAVPLADPNRNQLSFRPIGLVQNEFDEESNQDLMLASESKIVLDADLEDGLLGLAPGDKLIVLFAFHQADRFDLLQHPRGDKTRSKRGLFTLRSPYRPNPIGVTEVELVAREGTTLTVLGLDAIDGTPVLDLKPA